MIDRAHPRHTIGTDRRVVPSLRAVSRGQAPGRGRNGHVREGRAATPVRLRPVAALNFQEMIARLEGYWADYGCVLMQPYHTELGAGTVNPATFLRCLGPEPWKAAYVEPVIRPTDGRYGENPFRFQHYFQYQVILKPAPEDVLDLYWGSLAAIGIDLDAARPAPRRGRLGAADARRVGARLGGLAATAWRSRSSRTSSSSAGSSSTSSRRRSPTALERLAMFLQGKRLRARPRVGAGRHLGRRLPRERAPVVDLQLRGGAGRRAPRRFDEYEAECAHLVERELPLPAYDQVLKCSHTFNLLDARGAISVTERAAYIGRVRTLARDVAQLYLEGRRREAAVRCCFEIGCEELPASACRERRAPAARSSAGARSAPRPTTSTSGRGGWSSSSTTCPSGRADEWIKGPPADRLREDGADEGARVRARSGRRGRRARAARRLPRRTRARRGDRRDAARAAAADRARPRLPQVDALGRQRRSASRGRSAGCSRSSTGRSSPVEGVDAGAPYGPPLHPRRGRGARRRRATWRRCASVDVEPDARAPPPEIVDGARRDRRLGGPGRQARGGRPPRRAAARCSRPPSTSGSSQLPERVIVTAMQSHQRYFPLGGAAFAVVRERRRPGGRPARARAGAREPARGRVVHLRARRRRAGSRRSRERARLDHVRAGAGTYADKTRAARSSSSTRSAAATRRGGGAAREGRPGRRARARVPRARGLHRRRVRAARGLSRRRS